MTRNNRKKKSQKAPMKHGTKTSSPTANTSKNSSRGRPEPHTLTEAGHTIELLLTTVGKRSETVELAETELENLGEGQLISTEDLPRPTYPAQPPEPPPEAPAKEDDAVSQEHAAAVLAYSEAMVAYEEKKCSWEETEAQKPAQKRVNLWVPVNIVHKAKLDGQEVKIFHTLRGPVMGVVLHEDLYKAGVYSPCLIDPNVQTDKIHFFPIAFAGFNFLIYKQGMGESIPQEAEIRGYAHFINRNRAGDYRFRMRAAYHHIDASVPEDSEVPVVPKAVREPLFGLVPTSNTEEKRQIEKMRQRQAVQPTQDA